MLEAQAQEALARPGQPGGVEIPAEIDLIQRQVGEARDIETVKEIHDRAEALRVYCRKHDGLMEAGNRLAGITALCERRIGQELRAAPKAKGGKPYQHGADTPPEAGGVTPTLAELGISKDQSAAYQDMAEVEEAVLLDAIARAGAEGREVTKRDIRRAVRETLGKRKASRPQICRRRMLRGLSCARQTASEP
jgi:hypothetical protein